MKFPELAGCSKSNESNVQVKADRMDHCSVRLIPDGHTCEQEARCAGHTCEQPVAGPMIDVAISRFITVNLCVFSAVGIAAFSLSALRSEDCFGSRPILSDSE
jgi:hypothetical protein